jgi:HD-GYP domain-containing protein (c-di-GMP phosphodiesterase class II)
MIPLSGTRIVPGQRLPFDVFSAEGRLLLLRGNCIASQQDAARLQSRGFYKPRPENRSTVFAACAKFSDRLAQIFEDVKAGGQGGSLSRRVKNLATELIETCDSDPDASFASIHLDIQRTYLVVHSMMNAIVCCRLALASGLSREQRLSLVCAALTHDVGLLDLTDFINSRDKLTEAERARVRQHVQQGIRMLGALGVVDPYWLDAIANHHEFLDGSGYLGKRGDELDASARILALADSYSAMLRPRPYRDRLMARRALESLYSEGRDRYDGPLIEILIWDLGFYPPGSVLRLRNHELALAIRNSPGILDGPNVAAFTDSTGCPLLHPVLRNTNDPEFGVLDVLDPALATRMGSQIAGCWAIAPRG